MEQTKERGGGANESEAFFSKRRGRKKGSETGLFPLFVFVFYKKILSLRLVTCEQVQVGMWWEERQRGREKTNQQTLHARLCLYVIERYLNNV